jgi:hypothetical protein
MATLSDTRAQDQSRPGTDSDSTITESAQPSPARAGGLPHVWYAYPAVRFAAVALCLAVAALAVWLAVLRPTDDSDLVRPGAGPISTSQADLAALSQRLDQPIYWAGLRSGSQLEATLTTSEYAYVRYLTANAPVGDASPAFLTVATYPTTNAISHLRSYANHERASTTQIPRGGIAVPVPGSPTSVYFARPGEDYQVEVYDPKPGEALHLIRSGAIEPVPGGVSPSQ